MKKLIPVLFLFLLVLPVSFAQDVNVSLYLLNLGKYDVGTGSFTADFYLQFQCDYDCSPPPTPDDIICKEGKCGAIRTFYR